MDILFYGANCFKLVTKESTIVVDDNLKSLGAKTVSNDNDVTLYTQVRLEDGEKGRLTLDSPGEYELADTTVIGIQARAYTDSETEKTATIYRLIHNDLQVVILGHVNAKLDDHVLEEIGVVDVLIVPVGGNGFTLDAEDAATAIKLLEPKVTIPSHYADGSLSYEVPQNDLKDFFAKIGTNPTEPVKILKLKTEPEPGVVVLERQ